MKTDNTNKPKTPYESGFTNGFGTGFNKGFVDGFMATTKVLLPLVVLTVVVIKLSNRS